MKVVQAVPVSHEALQQAFEQAYMAENAAHRRLSASPSNLHLRMKYDEAAQNLEAANQALESYNSLPECDYCPSKLHTEQEQSKGLCRFCQL